MLPVGVHTPVAGLYSSALDRVGHEPFTQVPPPPATSTWPFCSSVAVWFCRAVVMLPVALQVPAAGLYSSAPLVTVWLTPASTPPATSTCPFCSTVAVKPTVRAVPMLPVAAHRPVAGSYSSAVPGISTWPLCSSAPGCCSGAVNRLPVRVHVPDGCAATGAAGPAASAAASSPATGTAARLPSIHLCMPITCTLAACGHARQAWRVTGGPRGGWRAHSWRFYYGWDARAVHQFPPSGQ